MSEGLEIGDLEKNFFYSESYEEYEGASVYGTIESFDGFFKFQYAFLCSRQNTKKCRVTNLHLHGQ
jgi:hypothetical protein